jgi:hypothetical protein
LIARPETADDPELCRLVFAYGTLRNVNDNDFSDLPSFA